MALADFFKKIFGSKFDRDYKKITPVLNKVLAAYEKIDKLSDDELRDLSQSLKDQIRAAVAVDEARISEISQMLQTEIPMDQKVSLAKESEGLVKKVDEKIEEVLIEILPQAFAVMKSTARRFKDNPVIKVKATQFDRDLSATREFVSIDGDYALWQNHWVAGGNEMTWDMVHYDVQLRGGIVLHGEKLDGVVIRGERHPEKTWGRIAEMATGEGKTLVATLPVFLNALAGKGVHVVTVNDYLAKRDSEWMGPLYMFHGLSVDCIDKHEPNTPARKRAYACDITFGTNNEFGFDYLRDNMATSKDKLVQRKLHFAIVDEVDSVLIDDARTPLIISGPVPRGEDQQFNEFKPYVSALYSDQKALVNTLLNHAKQLIAAGHATDGYHVKNESELAGLGGRYYAMDPEIKKYYVLDGGDVLFRVHKGYPKYKPLIKFLAEPGMKQLLQDKEGEYIKMNDKRMPIITDDLYFVINEKQHSVDLTDKGRDLISRRYHTQNPGQGNEGETDFFKIPDVGDENARIEKDLTLSEDEKQARRDEINAEYALKSERVHTVSQLLKAYTMFEKDVDYVIVDGKIKIVDEQTGRIMEGRRWSDGLHQAVEAKEGVDIEAATQTFATITLQNYFRQYHKLSGMTGTAETEAGEFWTIYGLDVVVVPTHNPIQRKDNNDLIYKTKKAKYEAVIAKVVELRDEGRPVLIGTTDVETSELLSRMLRLRGIQHQVLNAKQHAREAEVVKHAGEAGTVTIATNMAGRGTDIKLTREVEAAGGLAIIGTERHDSRRVDRQLRGRAGRQGDNGSSVFYVSLEDKLMRLFGSERIAGIVDKLGMKDDEALEANMLSGSIEKAQKKIEEINFGSRKRLIEYDDIMNTQREVVYSKRRNALFGDKIDLDIEDMKEDIALTLVDVGVKNELDYEDFVKMVNARISLDLNYVKIGSDKLEALYTGGHNQELADVILEEINALYDRRMDLIVQRTLPIFKSLVEKNEAMPDDAMIRIPVSDGKIIMGVTVNIKKVVATEGRELKRAICRSVVLSRIDECWTSHLREMDDLKQSSQNAAYEQKDPILVYKLESYNLFDSMLADLSRMVIAFLMRANIPLRDGGEQPADVPARRRPDVSQMNTSRTDLVTNSGEPKSKMPVHVEKQVGRNDPCPCGSGKKFKNCHGKQA